MAMLLSRGRVAQPCRPWRAAVGALCMALLLFVQSSCAQEWRTTPAQLPLSTPVDLLYHVGPDHSFSDAFTYCSSPTPGDVRPLRLNHADEVELLNILRYTRVQASDKGTLIWLPMIVEGCVWRWMRDSSVVDKVIFQQFVDWDESACDATIDYYAVFGENGRMTFIPSEDATFTAAAVCEYVQCEDTEYRTQSGCTSLTQCDYTQEYDVIPATPTTDRDCASLTTCDETEYETLAPTATTDRECKGLTVCNVPHEYESVAATASTDRECAPTTQCTDIEYETVAVTASTDRSCRTYTFCDLTAEVEVRRPTATSDRKCEPMPDCVRGNAYEGMERPDDWGEDDDTIDENEKESTLFQTTGCRRITRCGGKEYQSRPHTPFHTALCSPVTGCEEDEYLAREATDSTDNLCLSYTTCQLGSEYEARQPTDTTDRECRQLTTCGKGMFETKAPTATTDRACEPYMRRPEVSLGTGAHASPTLTHLFNNDTFFSALAPMQATVDMSSRLLITSPDDVPLSVSTRSTGHVTQYDPFLSPLERGYQEDADAPFTTSWDEEQGILSIKQRRTLSEENTLRLAYVVVVDVNDGRDLCVLSETEAHAGPCEVRVMVVIPVIATTPCPSNQHYVLLNGDTTAPMAWSPIGQAAPRASPLVHFSHTLATGSDNVFQRNTYTQGVFTHTFEIVPGVLPPTPCVVEVAVVAGVQVAVDSVGHIFLSGDTSGTDPVSLDYIVDQQQISGGGVQATELYGPLNPTAGLGISFRPPEGESFSFQVPNAATATALTTHVTFCQQGSQDGWKETASSVDVRLVFEYPTRQEQVALDSSSSLLSRDGRCFSIVLSSDAFPQSFELSSISLILNAPAATGATPINTGAYPLFVAQDQNFVVYKTDYITSVNSDPGAAVTIRDVTPPTFVDCPSVIRVQADRNSATAVASWDEPTATDNVEVRAVEASHSPDSSFSVAGSPHQITYTAEDTSFNEGTCVFLVIVDFEQVPARSGFAVQFEDITPMEIGSVSLGPNVVQSVYADEILSPSNRNPRFYSFTDIVPDTNTMRVSLRPVNDETFALVFGEENVRARFVVDLTFVRLSEAQASGTGANANASLQDPLPLEQNEQALASAGLQLGNLTLPQQTPFGGSTDTSQQGSDSAFFADGEGNTVLEFFSSADTTLKTNGTTGAVEVLRVRGSSAIFTQELSFTSVGVALQYPGLFPLASGSGRRRRGHGGPHDQATFALSGDSSVRVEYLFVRGGNAVGTDERVNDFLTFEDDVPPTYGNTCPGNITASAPANDSAAVVTWTEPQATDNRRVVSNVGSITPPVRLAVQGPASDPYRVQYVATDQFGATAECVFFVRVEDVTAPAVTCPASLTLTADGITGLAALDESERSPEQVQDNGRVYTQPDTLPGMGTAFDIEHAAAEYGIGISAAAIRVTDEWGNTGSCTFQVEVTDITPPVPTNCPSVGPSAVSEDGEPMRVSWTDVRWTDNAGAPTINASHASDTLFSVGTTLVTIHADDDSGNRATCAFNVTVVAAGGGPGAGGSTASSLSTGGIVGVVMSVLVVIAILCVIIVVLVVRTRKQPHDFEAILEEMKQLKAVTGFDTGDGDGPVKPRELRRSYITTLEELGTGNFGSVAKGLMNEPGRPQYLVAIKTLHEEAGEIGRRELLQESAVMAQFQHPNVVGLAGVVTAGEPMLMVIEFCELGALNTYLAKHPTTLKDKYSFSCDCAAGLGYLAKRGFVHRDIAARNILLDSEKRCKVSDFGLSRDTEHSNYYHSRKGGALPVRWTAPEALENQKFSSASDCWSYGILLYEIWTKAARPYQEWSNQKVWAKVTCGYRLPKPAKCPNDVYQLMLMCWHFDPFRRPAFQQLHEAFEALKLGLPKGCALLDSTAGKPEVKKSKAGGDGGAGADSTMSSQDPRVLYDNTRSTYNTLDKTHAPSTPTPTPSNSYEQNYVAASKQAPSKELYPLQEELSSPEEELAQYQGGRGSGSGSGNGTDSDFAVCRLSPSSPTHQKEYVPAARPPPGSPQLYDLSRSKEDDDSTVDLSMSGHPDVLDPEEKRRAMTNNGGGGGSNEERDYCEPQPFKAEVLDAYEPVNDGGDGLDSHLYEDAAPPTTSDDYENAYVVDQGEEEAQQLQAETAFSQGPADASLVQHDYAMPDEAAVEEDEGGGYLEVDDDAGEEVPLTPFAPPPRHGYANQQQHQSNQSTSTGTTDQPRSRSSTYADAFIATS